MKIVLDRPVAGYTEIATDPTRERTADLVGFCGWHGLVLFGEGMPPRRVYEVRFFAAGWCLVDSGRRLIHGETLEDALEEMLRADANKASHAGP